ncbi:hypothetical protein [Macrococcus psychrotolerans]|uniref:YtxH domain-containing protein n=1 Tax=Macrococcus psychrotolerans TaxID=3039389 RepID=A0AAU6RJR0_9STAP
MSVGTIIFILIAVISGVSSLLDNDKKNTAPGKKAGTSKGLRSEFQKQLQQIEATINQGMNDKSTRNATTQARGQTVGQVKPKKVVQRSKQYKREFESKGRTSKSFKTE